MSDIFNNIDGIISHLQVTRQSDIATSERYNMPGKYWMLDVSLTEELVGLMGKKLSLRKKSKYST